MAGIVVTKGNRNSVKNARMKKERTLKGVSNPDYELFRVNAKEVHTLYVPNLTESVEALDEDGNVMLDDDSKPIIVEDMAIDHYKVHQLHEMVNGKLMYRGDYRCVHGIEMPDAGLDGSCPLCDAYFQTETKWVREKAQREAQKQGLVTTDPNYEAKLKAIKKNLWSQCVVTQSAEKVTLPVFELVTETVTNKKTGKPAKKPVKAKDKDGNQIYIDGDESKPMYEFKAYFYPMAESRYQKFFCDTVSGATDDEVTIPAGRLFRLNAGTKGNAMQVAKDTNVFYKGEPEPSLAYMYEYFDRIAKEKYTDVDAMNFVLANQLHSVEELTVLAKKYEAQKLTELAIFEAEETKTEGATATEEADAEIENMLADVEAE